MSDEVKPKRSTLIKRKQKAHGDSLRAWLQDRAEAASKRDKEAAEARRRQPRGVDRVPERFRRSEVGQVSHDMHGTDDNYFARRSTAKRFGTRLRLPSGRRGKFVKAELRPGTNQPYYNPERDQRNR